MWLQECCELVKNKMPESHTFVIFGFPVAGSDRCYYASNATRDSAIEALRQWLDYQQQVNHWMTHDAGAPPRPPWAGASDAIAVAADQLEGYLHKNVGTTADYPLSLKGDEDSVPEVVRLLTALRQALKPYREAKGTR